jgi:predicted esterase
VILGGYSSGAVISVPLAISFAKKNIFFRNVVCMSPVFDFSDELRKWEELKQWE